MRTLRVALVQLEARDDVDATSRGRRARGEEAAVDADLVVLPEYVQYRGTDAGSARRRGPCPARQRTRSPPSRASHGCWVLAGSHAEASADPARP